MLVLIAVETFESVTALADPASSTGAKRRYRRGREERCVTTANRRQSRTFIHTSQTTKQPCTSPCCSSFDLCPPSLPPFLPPTRLHTFSPRDVPFPTARGRGRVRASWTAGLRGVALLQLGAPAYHAFGVSYARSILSHSVLLFFSFFSSEYSILLSKLSTSPYQEWRTRVHVHVQTPAIHDCRL